MIGRSCTKCRKSFLLTPLREGRRKDKHDKVKKEFISTHAPAGGATAAVTPTTAALPFLLTPLREGRLLNLLYVDSKFYFYSRPCGRGDALRWL